MSSHNHRTAFDSCAEVSDVIRSGYAKKPNAPRHRRRRAAGRSTERPRAAPSSWVQTELSGRCRGRRGPRRGRCRCRSRPSRRVRRGRRRGRCRCRCGRSSRDRRGPRPGRCRCPCRRCGRRPRGLGRWPPALRRRGELAVRRLVLELAKHSRVYLALVRMNVMSQMEYRANFVTGILMELGYPQGSHQAQDPLHHDDDGGHRGRQGDRGPPGGRPQGPLPAAVSCGYTMKQRCRAQGPWCKAKMK